MTFVCEKERWSSVLGGRSHSRQVLSRAREVQSAEAFGRDVDGAGLDKLCTISNMIKKRL